MKTISPATICPMSTEPLWANVPHLPLPPVQKVTPVPQTVTESKAEQNRLGPPQQQQFSGMVPVVVSTQGPAGIVWKGLPYLLPLVPDMEGKTKLTEIVAELNDYLVRPEHESECDINFAMVRKLFTLSASDQDEWISNSITSKLIVLHQAILVTMHIAGVRRSYFVEMLDAIHVEFLERISFSAKQKDSEMVAVAKGTLEYYYDDYDTFLYIPGDDLDVLLKIKELERTVPFVVRSLVTKFFQDVS